MLSRRCSDMSSTKKADLSTSGEWPRYRVVYAHRLWGSSRTSLLTPEELDRGRRYRSADDRNRYLTGAALVRMLVGEVRGLPPSSLEISRVCADCDGSHGPPIVKGGPYMSVAHSGDYVAVGLGFSPVGIDLEQVSHRARQLLNSRFARRSRGWLTGASDTCLTLEWVKAEALDKLGARKLPAALPSARILPAPVGYVAAIAVHDRLSKVEVSTTEFSRNSPFTSMPLLLRSQGGSQFAVLGG